MAFIDKWLEAVDIKNSVLCAGLDPAEFKMGRGEKGLPEGADKREWSIDYLKAVAPYCAAIKININYWKNEGDMKTLAEITEIAHSCNLVVIEDSKLADIGSTNDAGFYYAKEKSVDAVTFSPFSGNTKEAGEQARQRDLGIISMCLMSNPGYETEKNKLVPVLEEYPYYFNVKFIDGVPYVKQYISLACKSRLYGLDGIVIGAPSPDNHITEQEIADVREYTRSDLLVLMPGVGAQGGEA